MQKIILCDLPNTLFDSRHRTNELGNCITTIKDDTLNYGCYRLLKDLIAQGYQPVYTHYALQRLVDKVHNAYKPFNLPAGQLHINFPTQEVTNNTELKQYLCNKHIEPIYAIDNDSDMSAFYSNNSIVQIKVPLI